jgi:hypothetical protein
MDPPPSFVVGEEERGTGEVLGHLVARERPLLAHRHGVLRVRRRVFGLCVCHRVAGSKRVDADAERAQLAAGRVSRRAPSCAKRRQIARPMP